jgi:hypothetical protein
MSKRVWTVTDHDGHWPVGVASVVVADSEERARMVLDGQLEADGLRPFAQAPYTLIEVPLDREHAVVLCNGEY